MRAGYLPIGTYLKLVQGFGEEGNCHIWCGLVAGLRTMAEIFVGDSRIPSLERFARDLLQATVEKVGWEERAGESPERQLLRATVLDAATYFGDRATVAEVSRRFGALGEDLAAVPPNLQGVVFTGAARHGGDDVLDKLITLYEKVQLPETRVRLLKATGAFRREASLRRAIAYALQSGKVRPQDGAYVFSGTPIETRAVAWASVKENWNVIDERYGRSSILGTIIAAAAGGIPSEAHAKDVRAFFKVHPAPKAKEAIKHTLEGISARAKFRSRNRGALKAYFDRA
jgi:aminopeptidase N